ncbi:MAG: hypothetical protein FWC34_03825 [Bacteroidetes bacterium]|nr:hypothetical protein [Bacteroidota bacterium]MCL2303432.1 hypothetical protein [Lentimicrobiaceae bacterium]
MDAVLICGIVFYALYKIIELFVRQKERRLMVEKLGEISPEVMRTNAELLGTVQMNGLKGNQFFTLRWAALLIGAGVGWFLGWVLFSVLKNQNLYVSYDTYSLTLVASTAICAGIALLIVYLIERKAYKERKKEE